MTNVTKKKKIDDDDFDGIHEDHDSKKGNIATSRIVKRKSHTIVDVKGNPKIVG